MKLLLQPKPDRRKDYATDEAKWQAVVAKDHRADGEFYYSVKTTGVYCRPSCPARSALRKNVAFHSSTEDAEKAGFRACKRCSPVGRTLAQEHTAAVAKACRTIKQAEEFPNLNNLARAVGMSPYHFHRVFKAITGLTPKAYANAHRSDRLRKALPQWQTVTEAIYESGFNSNGRFYANSSKMLAMKPKEYRDGGTGTTIRFAIGECSLGSILVASSEKGVCAISMGDNPDALARDLQDRFRKANLIGGDRDFEKTVAKVVGLIEAPRVGFDLPLDVRGTAFQQRGLAGAPRDSGGLDGKLHRSRRPHRHAKSGPSRRPSVRRKRPRGRHPLPSRTDGDLSGYRWGVERKRVLLEREKAGFGCWGAMERNPELGITFHCYG